MNTELKYLPIHWKNGMAFSEKHLQDNFLAIIERIRDAAALHLNSHNYGLLGGDGQENYADSLGETSNNELAEVSYCRAITQDGSRIEILNKNWDELSQPLDDLVGDKNLETSNYWYLILITDPFTRIPEGKEDTNSGPRRKPHTRPAYGLDLIPLSDLQLDNLANAIPIVKYETTAKGLRKIQDYIPPCARISSHKLLTEKFQTYDRTLNLLKEHCKKIIEKIRNKRIKSQANHLADDIDALCKKYLDFFVLTYDQYKLLYKDQPPLLMAEYFSRMARVLDHTIETGYNKSHMLQYFRQYATDINAAQLGKIITKAFAVKYVHYDITSSLEAIDEFLNTFSEIFERLVKLDYKELAPKNVVETTEIISDRKGPRRSKTSTIKPIIIKNTGRERLLGGDLEDDT